MTVWSVESGLNISDAVLEMLRTGLPYDVYDAEVPPEQDLPKDPVDGRVGPYAVFFPSPGMLYSTVLCDVPKDRDYTFQVTYVGGDRSRCEWAVDRGRELLTGHRLDLTGVQTSLITEDGNPGRFLRDTTVTPTRTFVPFTYALHVTG